MRLAVVGNCQVRVLAEALALLLPHDKVETFSVGFVKDFAAAAEELRQCDAVISHPLSDRFGALATARLEEHLGSRLHMIPTITFTGFQPDSIYVFDDGKPVLSPMGGFHSAILVKAYLRGLPSDAALELFNPFVYSRAGYFEAYEDATAKFTAYGRTLSYDLKPLIETWFRTIGCFTHTFNHPNKRVLISLARVVCARAGLGALADDIDDQVTDYMLQGGIWPIYPEIANLLELPSAGTDFTTRFSWSHSEPKRVSLPDFAEQSFALYQKMNADSLAAAIAKHPARDLAC